MKFKQIFLALAILAFATVTYGDIPLNQEELNGHYQSDSTASAGLGYEYFDEQGVMFLAVYDYNVDGSATFTVISATEFEDCNSAELCHVAYGTELGLAYVDGEAVEIDLGPVEVVLDSCENLTISVDGFVRTYTRIGVCPTDVLDCSGVQFSPSFCSKED